MQSLLIHNVNYTVFTLKKKQIIYRTYIFFFCSYTLDQKLKNLDIFFPFSISRRRDLSARLSKFDLMYANYSRFIFSPVQPNCPPKRLLFAPVPT